ncbi:MAG: pyruvate carboxylase [Pirellulales bacterium]|nr:pyruvate carboxylase [Pirellulales bacterium]
MKTIRKLLVANRSEIAIRVFRTGHELGIRTVGIFSHEDRYALHRFKADEAYEIGKPGEPIRSYLDIPGIIEIATEHGVDAIHPGYGFLSENPDLARACEAAGIIFVGPPVEALDKLGDKVTARHIAHQAGVPILSGSENPLTGPEEAARLAEKLGYPVLLKAAKGGGGRGMRVVTSADKLAGSLEQAQREALNAFGSDDVFLEKFIGRAKHIEVQLLGDKHGNLLHLYERDCSLQRRHQKVVELAPAVGLDPKLRMEICDAAIKIGRAVNYNNAGTVEFLVDADTGKFFFIEVNPRIQVEHTVTEAVTGIDIVKSQILVAAGAHLSDPEIGLPTQESVELRGFALQARVTTEDPENQFRPDYGRVSHYRSAGGMGIRLDAGTAFSGAVVTPYYDSLLVKVTAWGRRYTDALDRMERALQEFRIRGVKTNIPFLINILAHPTFRAGECTTRFIDETPALFQIEQRRDRATKLFTYMADVIVNRHPAIKTKGEPPKKPWPPIPQFPPQKAIPEGTRNRLQKLGAEKFCAWVRDQKPLLVTDTTMRDAHQSLLATRVRTYDLLQIAEGYAHLASGLFSLEMWGGATFDTSMRFLKECPWQRLADLRTRIPNILFQMLLRASNAVGYSNYPDNVVEAFVDEAAQTGMDVFRIFDSLNWVPNMRIAIEAVRKSGMIAEATVCYTGDILDPQRTKYNLKYYVDLAKELEGLGAHMLAIKDMAGLCKPAAAELLVKTLRQEIGLPIHFHTHDTAGVQAASLLKASEAGVDVVDAALAPMSGMTSQPNLNSLVETLRFTPRDTGLDTEGLYQLAQYWEAAREFYAPFEEGMKASSAEVYAHEMPGGQFTNLRQQATAVGLGERWRDVWRTYADINQMLGDIVKVTPSSKAVGDLALFLVANNLSCQDLMSSDRELAFPESVVDLLSGRMGQPPGGFPPDVQKRILRGEKPLTDRPGATLAPADFEATAKELEAKIGRPPARHDVISYIMFPRVYLDFAKHEAEFSDTSILPTPLFFYGYVPGEEVAIELEPGKTLIAKFSAVGDPHEDGRRTVFFDMNGQPRSVTVTDRALESSIEKRPKADAQNPLHVGAPMPGLIFVVAVQPGDEVAQGQKLLSLEAMKMETTIYAERAGQIAEVLVQAGTHVETGDLLVRFE